jgi:transposase
MPEQYQLFVGIDWATEFHQVCVINADRQILEQKAFEHSGGGIALLVEMLLKQSGNRPDQVAISIEMPRGAVVETLVERQFAVFSLNPKQMDRFRDRHTVPGAKDDSRDAFVMADSLRTDIHLFHRVRLDDKWIIRLRELSRAEEDLQQESVRAGHRLRELLIRYYPQMLKLCPGVDEAWFWDLIEMAPSPSKASKLKRSKVEQLLKSHRIRRLDGEKVLAQLNVAALVLAPGAVEAASEHVLLLLPLLRLLRQQKTDLAKRIQALLEELAEPGQSGEHRDVTILLSLPGVGRIVAATMLAEASQPIAERDYHALRSYAGAAPITRQSGKRRIVVMRQSCNPRLRDALYHWARVSAQNDERGKKHYIELRAKGHSHGRALRGMSDRLLAVLIAMLRSKTLYDPAFSRPKAAPEAPSNAA